MVERLSQNIIGVREIETHMKVINCLSQSISVAVEDNALYSASVEERDTVCYFLKDQEIGLKPTQLWTVDR